MSVCVSDSGQLEKQLEDVTLARRDLEDSSKHIKALEKQMKSLTQERDDLHKVEPVLHGDPVCVCMCVSVWICIFLYINLDAVPPVKGNL